MKELAKQYDPSQVEDRIYQFWLDGGYFHTKVSFMCFIQSVTIEDH